MAITGVMIGAFLVILVVIVVVVVMLLTL